MFKGDTPPIKTLLSDKERDKEEVDGARCNLALL